MTRFSDLIHQSVLTVPDFELECGYQLKDAPVAYKTWGKLNDTKDNVMIICHAFTGSADVEDWWGPLMGPGKAFDATRFFVFCANVIGSPYGTVSPVSINPVTGKTYGPEFPSSTIRDDIRLHKLVLDHLGVNSVAVVIGGSMGGMAVLEWPLCTPTGYVRHVIPLATSARHSAWCISWGEAQRQSIYSDPVYEDGYYTSQPASGLAAARMSALLTYRSRDSFESRFGRKYQIPTSSPKAASPTLESPPSPGRPQSPMSLLHNEGHRNSKAHDGAASLSQVFSAQSYLRYQGDKFTARFDANCYIHITRKLDTHDVSRDRRLEGESEPDALARVLSTIPAGSLVMGIATDGLFTITEQREIAAHIPKAELIVIESPDGHDGFLLEFEQINEHILRFLHREFPEIYASEPLAEVADADGFDIKKDSVFGEAEVDITQW
ncbi:homoserine O-acetyltransferase [Cylindrobasidium torrendii FP15055 ss-10]|uniref:Homoserine O-acetyltransferase n=1 Tax=Cylindrobasidium torrendii FP15055 ss-10 TaxID=1314674 RepID=A0A0D7BFI2_9AGAR|nr:homoserine O-acetyltransferase [Cylindrobasidium torrendii FP15055 ss-10]